MEAIFKEFTVVVSHFLEVTAVVLITIGAVEAIFKFFLYWFRLKTTKGVRREVWLNFGQWLLLGLEFTLAADIVKTAIAPTWNDIGQLGAIAVMRTFLSYFLERDMELATKTNSASSITLKKREAA
jgi:uncharacterized membrane protein